MPLILIGQDKSIFKQFLILPKQWNLPDGTAPLNPKDKGYGIMLSSFVSRDFGYGHDITVEELRRINEYRKNKCYLDEEASMEIY